MRKYLANLPRSNQKNTNQLRFIVTAIGSMSADIVISSLRRNFRNCEIVGTNIYPGEWLYITNKVDSFYQVPRALEKQYFKKILNIANAHQTDYIIPLTDPEVDILSKNRSAFENTKVALCNDETVSLCRDKSMLSSFFFKNPKVNVIKSYSITEALDNTLPYPIVAKPKKGRSSEGLKYLYSKEELLLLNDDYIIQEFIDGSIITVDVVRDCQGNVVDIPRKELIRSANGAGLSIEVFKDETLHTIVNEITTELRIIGCMNIEFIYKDGRYYLMDINPRFSAGIGFSRLAGYDFVTNHIKAIRDSSIKPIKKIHLGIQVKRQREYILNK